MAKIVVLADPADEEAITAAMDAAGFKVKVVEPTAANLLHIVIGMVDDGAPKEEEPPVEEPPAEEAPPAEEPPAEEVPAEEPIAQDSLKSLGVCIVDGEPVKAFEGTGETSKLFVAKLQAGAKTTYTINESQFSFWPAKPEEPFQRVVVECGKSRASLEIALAEADEAYILVGADIRNLFK